MTKAIQVTGSVSFTEDLIANGSSGTSGYFLKSNGAGSAPTWVLSSGGFTYTNVTGTTQSMAVHNGYIFTNAAQSTGTLPATFAVGDIIDCVSVGAGGLIIDYGSGVNIKFLGLTTTTTTGNITTVDLQCRITLMGIVANTTWEVINCVGNVQLN